MSDKEMDSLSCEEDEEEDEDFEEEEEDDEDDEDDEDFEEEDDDQKKIVEHNKYRALYLPSLIQAIKTCAKEGDLKSLNLRNLDLTASHMREFFKILPITQITELNLEMKPRGNHRWGMQQFTKQLIKSKVRRLCLRHCEVHKDEVLQLMQALRNTQITDLDLSCSSDVHLSPKSATTFVSHLLKSNVTRLSLAATSIMQEGLGKQLALSLPHTSITHLDVSHSLRHKSAITALFTSLPKTSVRQLVLGGNEITDDDLKSLCQNLRQTRLQVLNLYFNEITDDGINMLTEALINSTVYNLSVAVNKIKGANNLGRHLKETKICALNIGMNKIESYEMFSFPTFLEGTSVTDLDMDEYGLSDEEGLKLVKCLKSSKVTHLNIEGNNLGLPSVTEFARILKDTSIIEVNFSHNNLSSEAFQVLGDGLRGSKLRKLTVEGSCTYPQDGLAVAAFIDKTKGTALRSLNIRETNFQSDSIKILARSLLNTTLTNLNLSSCKIRAGITDLAPSLKHTAIKRLNLSENEISDDGAEKLAEGLKDTQIIDLNVSKNSIKIKGAKALLLCLNTTSLYHLDLGQNEITDNGITELAEMLEGTFITDLNVDSKERRKTFPMLTVLWKNRFLVYKLVSFFKSIMPATGGGPLRFGGNIDSDFTKYLEKCLLFYKAVIEQPSAINALAQAESYFFTRTQISQLVLEEYPSQFALFVKSKTAVDQAQHVKVLEKAVEYKLNKLVEHLLMNQPAP